MKPSAKENLGIVGVGAVACAACCAGPVLGFIAAVGALAATLFGVGALVAAALVIVFVVLRRRRAAAERAPAGPVHVESPIRRSTTTA